MDICATTAVPFVARDSNPGMVRTAPGGVGRNIATALREHGQEVLFVTALPGGMAGDALKQDCIKRGLDLSRAVDAAEGESMYLSLHSREGEMLLAVNDMSAAEHVTYNVVKAASEDINRSAACVVDANLSEEALKSISDCMKVPLVADAVSVSKCSLGKDGLYYLGENGEGLLPPERTFSCQTTGAGDSLCAGLAMGTALGLDVKQTALLGQKLAFERLSQNEIKAQFTAP